MRQQVHDVFANKFQSFTVSLRGGKTKVRRRIPTIYEAPVLRSTVSVSQCGLYPVASFIVWKDRQRAGCDERGTSPCSPHLVGSKKKLVKLQQKESDKISSQCLQVCQCYQKTKKCKKQVTTKKILRRPNNQIKYLGRDPETVSEVRYFKDDVMKPPGRE